MDLLGVTWMPESQLWFVHHEMEGEVKLCHIFMKRSAVINCNRHIYIVVYKVSVLNSGGICWKGLLLFKSTEPALSLVPFPEVLLNRYAIVAKRKPWCKCAELHCQMRSITLPVEQLCTKALLRMIYSSDLCFIQNQTWLLDKKENFRTGGGSTVVFIREMCSVMELFAGVCRICRCYEVLAVGIISPVRHAHSFICHWSYVIWLADSWQRR